MKMSVWRLLWIGSLCLFSTIILLATSTANSVLQAATPSKANSDVLSMLQATGLARVIVQLQSSIQAAGQAEMDEIAALQEGVLGALPSADFELTHRFQSLPAFAGSFSANGIAALQANPAVASIILDLPGEAHLRESVPALRADVVSNTYGLTGAGVTVAILDTGIDTNHVDLADAIVGQRCFTNGNCQPGNLTQSASAQDLNGHGTHVSGIITSNGTQAPRGFATNAKIVAVRVLDQPNNGQVSDWIAGLDWLNANFATTPVDIVNMSLGTFTLYSGNCDAEQPQMAAAISNLRAKGVVIFASSGNQGSSTQIASPACNSGVVAVGATYDSNVGREPNSGTYSAIFGGSVNCFDATTSLNTLACFTNSNSQLDLLAPGAPIESTQLGGGSTTYYGTSQASPTAAGVAALMLEKDPSLTPDEIEALMKSSGTMISDTRNSLAFPRIFAITAVNAVDFYNHIAPTSVAINGASSGVTNSNYSFTATVSPISSTLPLTYSWAASGSDTTYVFTDDATANVTFKWLQPGTQVITVTAENEYGSASNTHSIEISPPNMTIAISDLALTGAASGLVDLANYFTATVAPIDASLPITYQWQAAGQMPITISGDREEKVSFVWSAPGTYSVAVTATNASLQSVSDSLQILIKSRTPQTVSLKGASSGAVNQPMIFLASVSPNETQTPVTFTWSAADQPTKIRVGSLNDNVNFSWQEAGVYTISVKAENSYGSVTASRQITINRVDVIVPITGVSMLAPSSGLVDELLHFTATVTPADSSQPVTYLWEAFGQAPIEQVTGTSASIALAWQQPGTYPITVTASNAGGTETVVKNVEIKVLSPFGIIIDGPELIAVGEQVTYTATLIPNTTGQPVTYVWSATDQIPITHTGGVSDQVSYIWDKPGSVTVSVAATNVAGTVQGEKTVDLLNDVDNDQEHVYLPLIGR